MCHLKRNVASCNVPWDMLSVGKFNNCTGRFAELGDFAPPLQVLQCFLGRIPLISFQFSFLRKFYSVLCSKILSDIGKHYKH